MAVGDLTWFDVVRANGRDRRERTALVFDGVRLTHGDLLARAERLAAGLARAGLGRGDRLAIVAGNRPEMLDAVAAAARLGAILVPVNWRLGADEMRAILRDADPAILIAEAGYATTIASVAADLPHLRTRHVLDGVADGFDPYETLLAAGEATPDTAVASSDPLVIIHTAAVDGDAKGAVLTHGNILAADIALIAAWGLGPDDVALGALPLFHIAGLGLTLAVQHAGGATALMGRFDGAAASGLIQTEGVTVAFEFAPMLAGILDAAAPGQLGSLRAVWGLDSPETIARFEDNCPAARFWAGFGQSETTGFVTFAPHSDRPGTAGRPTPLVSLVVADEDNEPVPPGTVGEILVRGPHVFAGYWRREAATADTFRGGWHHTGDLGRLDADGYLTYAGRSPAKELIKSGGENVYPAEVERALREHPDVDGAVVFGVPDARWGEAVVAVCARHPGSVLDEETLIAFVGERIARFKRPKSIRFVDALPLMPTGAVDRGAVKVGYRGE